MATTITPTLQNNGVIATPNADVTPAQTAAAESSGWKPTPTPTYSRLPDSGAGTDYGFKLNDSGAKVWVDSSGKETGNVSSGFNETNDRASQIASRSSEFGAIENEFNTQDAAMRKTEGELGAKNLARANTVSAITGMSGSPDAATRGGDVERKTADIINTKSDVLMARKQQALNSILNNIDQNVSRDKAAALITDKAAAVKAKDEVSQNAQKNIMDWASQGHDFDSSYSTSSEFRDEIARSGKTPFEMKTLYNSALPKDKQPSMLFNGWKGDNYVELYRNPDGSITHNTVTAKEMGVAPGAEISTVTYNGKVYWYDKKSPYKADGTPNLIELGGKSPTKETPPTGPSKADISGALTWMRTQSDYSKDVENLFNSDPVIQAKIIQAYKQSKSM